MTSRAFAAGALLLLAVGVVRILTPDRPRIRPLSVEGIAIGSQPIAQGRTIVAASFWVPPADVYVLAWEPWIGAAGSGAELDLLDGDTRVFGWQDGAAALPVREAPTSTGYLVRRERPLTLRLRITNTGPSSVTRGARAFVYFVPVEGN